MSESFPVIVDGVRPRFRAVITTVLLILISALIVRDILGRRRTQAPASGVTARSR